MVDSRAAALAGPRTVILSEAKIYAEIGAIFAGTKKAPYSATTVFKSFGIAIEDIAAVTLVFDNIASHLG